MEVATVNEDYEELNLQKEKDARWQRTLAFARLCSKRIPHVHQRHSWDCGLACVEMALQSRALGVGYAELTTRIATNSIWSIDLAYILASFNIKTTLCTLTPGVHPEYVYNDFYKKDFEEDRKRVERKFKFAAQCGVTIQQRSMPSEELQYEVGEQKTLAIVLVDVSFLRYSLCDNSADQPVAASVRSFESYRGHYILLCGYDRELDVFIVKDPSRKRAHCIIPSAVLHRARRAYGTDEDIVLLSNSECS